MLATDRYKSILDTLRERGSASIRDLSIAIKTSESTIRRDLKYLEDEGLISRVYGGARLKTHTYLSEEKDNEEKHQLFLDQKRKIGEMAVSLIKPHDFVFIDGGTTTEAMLSYLTVHQATYVTNGLTQAQFLNARGFKTYMLGGLLKATTEVTCGAQTVKELERLNFSVGFFGTNGIDSQTGFTTPDLVEGAVKARALKRSEKAFILADESKFGKVYAMTFGDLDQAKIITAGPVDPIYKEFLLQMEDL